MDITVDNFEQQLPFIKSVIREANFFSIDTELTGLSSSNFKPSFLDTIEERYKRTSISVAEFLIIEFGLCAFKWNDEKRR